MKCMLNGRKKQKSTQKQEKPRRKAGRKGNDGIKQLMHVIPHVGYTGAQWLKTIVFLICHYQV